MRQLGINPEEFERLSKEETIARVAEAQEKHCEDLLARGIDVSAITPEIGQDVAWIDIVRQVFRVLDFDGPELLLVQVTRLRRPVSCCHTATCSLSRQSSTSR